ncbi:MAG: copper homeostasis protein CutC [Bacteroidia bacterium]
MKIPLLEIAIFNIESASIAQKNGADRIELCANMKEGGISPPFAWVILAKQLNMNIHIMVRPRPGNFAYNTDEFRKMKEEILSGKEQKADGFVFGILNAHNKIDELRNKELVELAAPLPCTFHRAFDELENKPAALETLISCGFKRVLTSGGKGKAVDHYSEFSRLISLSANRIIVMPGGGIRSANIKQLLQTGATEFHSAAITGNAEIADGEEIKKIKIALQS